jgi:hypothetical protein
MTTAVCFKCGAIKFGAFVPCPECGGFPRNEDELALSLAMTDHYFDMPTLDQMGASVRDGTPPHLDPQTHAQLVAEMRSTGLLAKLQAMQAEMEKRAAPSPPQQPPPETQ